MCRAIKTLHNFSPPATNDEIRASSLQFVRKLSGFTIPSHANEDAFNRAIDEIAHAAHHLLESLVIFTDFGDRLTFEPSKLLSLEIVGPYGDELDSETHKNLVMRAARTGTSGDGHICVMPVEHRYSIATGRREV